MRDMFYLVITVYESSSNKQDYEPLYEECFSLITASSDEQAREKAQRYANLPNSYKNVQGETITWSLKQLVDVRRLLEDDDFSDGTELYARFFRDYKAYRAFDESAHPFSLDEE